ncbi:hypothetical protein EI555_019293, partial [Monodon monoceros]
MSLLMISENVKLAREYALLGNYDSAMVYYQGVLDQMNKYLYSVKDTYLQQKWQQVWQEINVEAKHVKDIMKTLESFKLDSTPLKAAQHELPASEGEVWSLPVPVERRVTVQVQLSEFTVHPHTVFTMTEGKLFVVGKRKNRIKEERK